MNKYDNLAEIEKMLSDLQSKDNSVRTRAANELGKIDTSQQQIATRVVTALQPIADRDPYKLARDMAKNSIRKISEPGYVEKLRAETSALQQNQASGLEGPHYAALRTLGVFYGILGWIVLIFSIIAGVIGAITLFEDAPGPAFIVLLGLPIFGATLALPMLAAQDFFSLLINQAKDVRSIKADLNFSKNEEN